MNWSTIYFFLIVSKEMRTTKKHCLVDTKLMQVLFELQLSCLINVASTYKTHETFAKIKKLLIISLL